MTDADLTGVKYLVGGPMRSLFWNGNFSAVERERVEMVVSSLRALGATVFNAHEAENYAAAAITSEMVTLRDHDWVRRCDIYLALWPARNGTPVPSTGTAVEIGWASMLNKSIVVAGSMSCLASYGHLIRGIGALTRFEFLDDAQGVESIVHRARDLGIKLKSRDGVSVDDGR